MKKNRMNVYLTTNLINGKIYVGQSIYDDPTYFGSGRLIYEMVNDLGKENFKKEILQECSTQKELDDREIYWIDKLHATNPEIGYNVSKGGNAPPKMCGEDNWMYGRTGKFHPGFGKNLSEETKRKISIANSNPSKETREKLSMINLGEGNPNYGKRRSHTEEEKKKIGDGNRNPSEETRRKMSESQEGKHPNKETRKKMSDSAIGKHCGGKNGMAKAVTINGVDYTSITESSGELNILRGTIYYRIKTGKEGYSYYDKGEINC